MYRSTWYSIQAKGLEQLWLHQKTTTCWAQAASEARRVRVCVVIGIIDKRDTPSQTEYGPAIAAGEDNQEVRMMIQNTKARDTPGRTAQVNVHLCCGASTPTNYKHPHNLHITLEAHARLAAHPYTHACLAAICQNSCGTLTTTSTTTFLCDTYTIRVCTPLKSQTQNLKCKAVTVKVATACSTVLQQCLDQFCRCCWCAAIHHQCQQQLSIPTTITTTAASAHEQPW